MSALSELAELLIELKKQEISEKVEAASRLCLLDAVGAGLFGSTLNEGRKIVDAVCKLGETSGVSVWGTPVSLNTDNAALVCGAFCHLRELDDVHYAILHPGAVCVPAAVVTAQREKSKLGDLLVAITAGVEAMVRISKGMDYISHRSRGWHGTATCGSFGAAAAAGIILGLDQDQMTNALGLAGSRTGGTWAFKVDGSMSKRLHPGFAARDGVLSAYLASEGISGPRYILEASDGGFYKVMSDSWNIKTVNEDNRGIWAVEEIEYKWYASCKSVHSPLEAAMAIYKENSDRKGKGISHVLVEVNHSSIEMAGKMYDKKSVVSAQLSIPYGVALGLLGKRGLAEDYALSCLENEEVYRLAAKVKVIESAEFNKLRKIEHKSGATVKVVWCDGFEASATVTEPKGSLANPLQREDLMEKFHYLSSAAIGGEKARVLADMIINGSKDLMTAELVQLMTDIRVDVK
ncbi:MAG: MmgE/PrpD family protein [Bacillota bacterium]|jgi:2-methylcitrate dehydratase PrpD